MSVFRSFSLGIRSSAGYFFSTFLFGIMFGVAASSAGVQYWHAMLMSGAVFSATAQFATIEFWYSPLPVSTIVLSVFLVSTRNILLGMSMASRFDGHSLFRRIIWLALLNDPGVVTSFSNDKKVDTLGYVTGYGVSLMVSWLISTFVGLTVAGRISGDILSAMSFAGPLVLSTMMVLFVKGTTINPVPWAISGAVALILSELQVSDYLVLFISVLCGLCVGILLSGGERD